MRRAEIGTERPTVLQGSRWVGLSLEDARDSIKAHGRTVRDIMTCEVISVEEATELAEVARVMETKRIKRVPVLRNGTLVGILSRANLVRALAAIDGEPTTAGDDREIRARLLAELNGLEWARVWPEEIIVQDGVVHLWVSETRPEAERGHYAWPPRTFPELGASRNTWRQSRCSPLFNSNKMLAPEPSAETLKRKGSHYRGATRGGVCASSVMGTMM